MDYTRVTEKTCSACEMRGRGGTEEPCVNAEVIRRIQAQGGICPRVELREDNEIPAQLAWFASKLGGDHPLWHKLFDLHTAEATHEERLDLFFLVIDAVSDPGISARIKSARERALREGQQGGQS